MELFSTPATSVTSECVFSTAGDIVNKKRNCLLPKNVDMLVVMFANTNSFQQTLCGAAWVNSKASKDKMFNYSLGSILDTMCRTW